MTLQTVKTKIIKTFLAIHAMQINVNNEAATTRKQFYDQLKGFNITDLFSYRISDKSILAYIETISNFGWIVVYYFYMNGS